MEEHLDEILLNPIQKGASETKEDPPVLGLQVSAGLGKTLTALKCIAKQGAEILKGGHILFYVPTLNLAEEAHTEFQNLNSKLPSLGVGGAKSARVQVPYVRRVTFFHQAALGSLPRNCG